MSEKSCGCDSGLTLNYISHSKHALVVLLNWFEDRTIMLPYKLRSGKQYQNMVLTVLQELASDAEKFEALHNGTLELYYNKETKKVTLKIEDAKNEVQMEK